MIKRLSTSLILALGLQTAQAEIDLSFSMAPELFFSEGSTDTAQMVGATMTFDLSLSQSAYGDIGSGVANVFFDSAILTVSGSANSNNNGTFDLLELTSGTFMMVHNFGGNASLLSASTQAASFGFGDVSVADFYLAGFSLDNSIAPGSSVVLSDFDGLELFAEGFFMNGTAYKSDLFTVDAELAPIPEPQTTTLLIAFMSGAFILAHRGKKAA